MFEKLVWRKDRILLDQWVFRLQEHVDSDWELGNQCFLFFKEKKLVDEYAKFWTPKSFLARNIVELGIWDGGSIAFWFEYFHPRKHVAIDLLPARDTFYFREYVKTQQLEGSVKTYWGTDQADSRKIHEIVKREFKGPLDLVIDDASHYYKETKASFEILFPLLRPGGLYVIEDWAWAHWKRHQISNSTFFGLTPLSKLIFELTEATGSSRDLISSLSIFQGFAVIERGEVDPFRQGEFRIEKWISKPPTVSIIRKKLAALHVWTIKFRIMIAGIIVKRFGLDLLLEKILEKKKKKKPI